MVFWIVMVVAVANISLGFAAAVYLARRYQRGIQSAIDSSFSGGSIGPDRLAEPDSQAPQEAVVEAARSSAP